MGLTEVDKRKVQHAVDAVCILYPRAQLKTITDAYAPGCRVFVNAVPQKGAQMFPESVGVALSRNGFIVKGYSSQVNEEGGTFAFDVALER